MAGRAADRAGMVADIFIVATLENVEHVDVLPFHRMCIEKYERLNMRFPLADVEPPDQALLDRVHAQFAAHGVVSI